MFLSNGIFGLFGFEDSSSGFGFGFGIDSGSCFNSSGSSLLNSVPIAASWYSKNQHQSYIIIYIYINIQFISKF